MTRIVLRWGLVPLLAVLLPLVLMTPVLAADPATLKLEAPKEAGLGDTVSVAAQLLDGNGGAIPGATIILWAPASFLSVGGSVQLGEAATDAQGNASFSFQPRSTGALTINAYFPGNSRYDAAQGSVELTVGGSAQLYQETVGVRVPGVGVWLLVGLMGVVWGVYFIVMVLVTLVARAGSEEASGTRFPGG